MKWLVFIYAINATINCVSILNVSFVFLQDEVKECLLMKDELVANKYRKNKDEDEEEDEEGGGEQDDDDLEESIEYILR